MAPLKTKPIPLPEVLDILEVSIQQLTEMTKLDSEVVRRAVMGGKHKTKDASAQLMADALGMEVYEIVWPCGLTDKGREPLTGGNYTKHIEKKVAEVCSECFLELPASNICSCA